MSAEMRLRSLSPLLVVMLLMASQGLGAQPGNGNQSKELPSAGSQEDSSAGEKKTTPEQKKSNSDSGEFIFMTPEELLKWRAYQKSLNKPADQRIPDYSVNSIELAGKADDTNATLEAIIHVQVNSEKQSVLVPLGLNEATLTKAVEVKSKSNGEATPGGFTRETGYRWWFKGKGRYELKLTFLVPIRKTVPSRRLLLSIPQTAVSHLKLQIPQPKPRLKVTPPEKSASKISEQKIDGKPGTMIELYGLGNTLDLQWQLLPNRKQVPPALHVETNLLAKQTSESILLTADQTIVARQGSFDEFGVQLPPGFKLIAIEGDRYDRHDIDPDNPAHVIVRLTEPTTERENIRLTWTLEKNFPEKGGRLTLEGFRVDKALRELGKIEIVALEGFNINKQKEANLSVHRTNVRPTNGNGRFLQTAYRFLEQPFRLVVDLQEIAPGYSSEPIMNYHVSPDRVELNALFRLHVHSGAIEDLELRWPNRDSEQWKIEFVESPDLIEQIRLEEESENGSIRIRLVSRKTGRFEIPLKASRRITPGEKPIEFSLPRVVGARRLPITLNVTSTENVEIDLLAGNQASLIEIPAESRQKKLRRFRIDPQPKVDRFSAKVTVHEQRIHTDTIVTLEVEDDRLQVEQQIIYEITYEPLSQIRVEVPQKLGHLVKFYSAEGTLLDPTWSDAAEDMFGHAGFMLDMPTIGEYVIVARFEITLPDEVKPGSPQTVSLPMIRSVDVDSSSGRIQFRDSSGIEVAVKDDSWTRQSSTNEFTVWNSNLLDPEVPITLTKTSRRPLQNFSVYRALIRTKFEYPGLSKSWAQYRIRGSVGTISLIFPPDVVLDNSWWDNRLLESKDILPQETTPGEYRLQISEEVEEGDFLLTVEFHSETATPFVWNKPLQVNSPRFSEEMWVEQTLREVTLPDNQHLALNPKGFTPQFDWVRGTVFWSRVSRPQYSDLDTWISAADGPALPWKTSTGNTYLFSRFGPTDTIVFYSMSRALVVLFGAGLALAVGFVLKKIKPLRSVMTLFVLAFALAIVGLWYVEPIKLLLQPALLGLFLAVSAASVEGFLKHRHRQPILTLSSPSDFISPSAGSTTEHPLLVGAGSEDPTTLRSASEASSEPVSSSDSGLGT